MTSWPIVRRKNAKLAAAIGLNPGDRVQWELLDRGELHLVRLEPPPPTTKCRAPQK